MTEHSGTEESKVSLFRFLLFKRRRIHLSREGIHRPADEDSDKDEHQERPGGVLDAFGGTPTAKCAERQRNNQSEEQHGLQVGERAVHGDVRPSGHGLLHKREARPKD